MAVIAGIGGAAIAGGVGLWYGTRNKKSDIQKAFDPETSRRLPVIHYFPHLTKYRGDIEFYAVIAASEDAKTSDSSASAYLESGAAAVMDYAGVMIDDYVAVKANGPSEANRFAADFNLLSKLSSDPPQRRRMDNNAFSQVSDPANIEYSPVFPERIRNWAVPGFHEAETMVNNQLMVSQQWTAVPVCIHHESLYMKHDNRWYCLPMNGYTFVAHRKQQKPVATDKKDIDTGGCYDNKVDLGDIDDDDDEIHFDNIPVSKAVPSIKRKTETKKEGSDDSTQDWTYFYICDKYNNTFIGRCHSKEKNGISGQNFVESYSNIFETSSDGHTQFDSCRQNWLIEYLLWKSYRDSVQYSLKNPECLYHCREFRRNLQSILTDSPDIRAAIWARPQEKPPKLCEGGCGARFRVILMNPYQCKSCGKWMCKNCSDWQLVNPATQEKERACIMCYTRDLDVQAHKQAVEQENIMLQISQNISHLSHTTNEGVEGNTVSMAPPNEVITAEKQIETIGVGSWNSDYDNAPMQNYGAQTHTNMIASQDLSAIISALKEDGEDAALAAKLALEEANVIVDDSVPIQIDHVPVVSSTHVSTEKPSVAVDTSKAEEKKSEESNEQDDENLNFDQMCQNYFNKSMDQQQAAAGEAWNIAREAAFLSSWVYSPETFPKDTFTQSGFEQISFNKFGAGNQLIQYAFVKSHNTAGHHYLVFRGSTELMDWLTNVQASPLPVKEFGFEVHSGMYAQMRRDVLPTVTKTVLDLFKDGVGNNKLTICGHSLGGGYAILSGAYLLSKQIHYPFDVYTFGAPLVVQQKIADSSPLGNELHKRTHNFVYQFDLVPRLQRGFSLEYALQLTSKGIGDKVTEYIRSWVPSELVRDAVADRLAALFHKYVGKSEDLVQMHELCKNYGPIGKYWLLFDAKLPARLLKGTETYIRGVGGKCLQLEPEIILQLQPKHNARFVDEIVCDHSISNYLGRLLFLNPFQSSEPTATSPSRGQSVETMSAEGVTISGSDDITATVSGNPTISTHPFPDSDEE